MIKVCFLSSQNFDDTFVLGYLFLFLRLFQIAMPKYGEVAARAMPPDIKSRVKISLVISDRGLRK